MFLHKVTCRLFVLVLIMCSSVNGMDAPPFTIKFAGTDREEHIEPSIIHMFPHLQNAYDQGIREQQFAFSPQSVKLALEIARLKKKVNKLVPTNIAIAPYKSALANYNNDEQYAAADFAQDAGNPELAELIRSLTQHMNIPKETALPSSKPAPDTMHSSDMLKERSKTAEDTNKKAVLTSKNFLDINVIKLLNNIVNTIEEEKTTDIGVLQAKFLKQYPQDLITADFNAYIEHIDALELQPKYVPVLEALTEAIWAERLIEKPTTIDLKPDDLKVRYDCDHTVAKIIMETALAKKYAIKIAPVRISSPYEAEGQDLYERSADWGFLCPTVSDNNVSMVFKQANDCVWVNRDYNYFWPLCIKMNSMDNTIIHADVSSDGKHIMILFKNQPNDRVKIGIAQKLPGSEELILNIFDLPLIYRGDLLSRVVFKKDSHMCFIKLVNNNGNIDYYHYNAALPMSAANQLTAIKINLIHDRWIQKFLSETLAPNECRGMLQDVPFFNVQSLHSLFFTPSYFESFKKQLAAYLKKPLIDIELQPVKCVADSCVHYILIRNKKNEKYSSVKLDFNPDPRLIPLLDFMNKKYESVKNATAASYALYPNTLYIALTYLADWYINPTKLRTHMGGLYQLVDPELKQLVEPHIYKEHSFDLARYLVYQKYQPYASSIKIGINGIKSGIKYTLGTLWWAAKWGAFAYVLYQITKPNKHSTQYYK